MICKLLNNNKLSNIMRNKYCISVKNCLFKIIEDDAVGILQSYFQGWVITTEKTTFFLLQMFYILIYALIFFKNILKKKLLNNLAKFFVYDHPLKTCSETEK